MTDMLRGDLYRLGRSKLLYGIAAFAGLVASALVMSLRQDIRIGISVFGSLTAFRGFEDVVRIGTEYQKGLGILVAILISVFIGQEYRWKTWQQKWIAGRSRTRIYVSKAILSSSASAAIYLLFELVAFLGSGRIGAMLADGYLMVVICGFAIYAALGSVICLFSMLIRNSTSSTIMCLCYVLFGETVVSVARNLINAPAGIGRLVELAIRHSIYGMSTIVTTTSVSTYMTASIVANSTIIMLASTIIGSIVFSRYEL